MIPANNIEQNPPESPGGRGEDSHLSPVQENKIVAMMLNKRNKFPVKSKHKRYAVETTERNMKDENGRVSNGAVANLIRMVKINQDEDKRLMPQTTGDTYIQNNTQVTNVSGVRIIQREDFYGNDAHTIERERDNSPEATEAHPEGS